MRELLERFYSLAVPETVIGTIVEQLTDHTNDDLVRAHIGRNWSYFGAIDKTLAGFVILDDEGDNYTLWDGRDSGQVWWQDHETRDLELQTDSIEDYIAWQKAVATARSQTDDWISADDYLAEFSAAESRAEREVPTEDLLNRYQWLVWICAQPMMRDGVETQSVDQLVRSSVGNFNWYWENDDPDSAFERELPSLATDPHLAVYWLLHAAWSSDQKMAQSVLDVLPEDAPELVQSFVGATSGIGPTHELEAVPKYRSRKAWLKVYQAFALAPDEAAHEFLNAIEIEPQHEGYFKALQVARALEDDLMTVDAVKQVIDRIDGEHLSTLWLETLVAKEQVAKGQDADPSEPAQKLLPLLADERWMTVLEVLWRIYEFVEPQAAAPLAATLSDADPYHARVAKIVADMAQETSHDGLPAAAVAAQRLEHAEALKPVLMPLFSGEEDQWLSITNELPEELKLPAALRMLVWADTVGQPAVGWAIQRVLVSDRDDKFELVRGGFDSLSGSGAEQMLEQVAESIESPDSDGMELLFAVLSLPAPEGGDFGAEYAHEKKVKTAVKLIAPHVANPPVFDRVMSLLEGESSVAAKKSLISELFSPFSEETYVVADLDDAGAQRVARALIDLKQSDNIHVANAAGHQLYRLNHTGAEDVITEALDEYGKRYVDDDSLQDLVANLYASLRSMQTESSRDSIVQRIFKEERSFWRLGSAFADLYYTDILDRAIAALRDRSEIGAAAAHMATLRAHCNDDSRVVELGEEVLTWPVPNDDNERAMLAYIMLETCRSGVTLRQYNTVKQAWKLAESLGEPYSPYHSIDRSKDYVSPFENEELRARLDDVLSGAAEARAQALRDAAMTAREAGDPNLEVSDEELGLLAETTVKERVFADRETGEVWFQDPTDDYYYFDGFDVADPDFEFVINPTHDPRSFFDGTEIVDRLMFWDEEANRFVAYDQWGARIIGYRGVNNGQHKPFGLVTDSVERASELFAALRANPPESMSACDPFYLNGRGAIIRKYYRPLAGGGWNKSGSHTIGVLDGEWTGGESFEDDAAAIAALNEYERETFVEHGGVLSKFEWSGTYRRNEDLTLEEWMERRRRRDGRTAAWHLRALEDVPEYLEEHGLGHLHQGFVTEIGEPAGEEEIQSFVAACSQDVHPLLLELWRECGRAQWSRGGQSGLEFLSPTEVLKRRDAVRAGASGRAQTDNANDPWHAVDALVVNHDGTPTLYYSDSPQPDGRQFAARPDDGEAAWWEKALPWSLATGMVSSYLELLKAKQPVLRMLHYGQRWHDGIQYDRWELDDSFFELLVDPEFGWGATRVGKVQTAGRVETHRFGSAAEVREWAEGVIPDREGDGWRAV